MDRKKEKQRGFSSLIGEKTPAKIAGLCYSAAACAFFALSIVILFCSLAVGEGETPQWYLYVSFSAAPVAFSLVAAWYFFYTGTPVKKFFKEQKCAPKYYLIAFLLQIGLLSLGELNGAFLRFLERFGYEDSGIILPSTKGFGLVGVLLVVAVLPAALEELFFRGIFLREMKDFSLWGKVCLCGGLFALYHQNPAQTVYQLLCGLAFALIAARAGSFLPTVLSHFFNNAFIILLYALGITSYSQKAYGIGVTVCGLCLVGALVWLFFDLRKTEKKKTEKGAYKQFFICALLGLAAFGFSWLATLLTGL